MRQARYRYFLLPLFLVLACAGLFAQANSEVTGIVTDQTGAAVAGASIVLTEPATGESHTTASGGTGLYDIAGLNPSTYDLKVTAKGFEAFLQKGIVVNVSSTARVDVKLTVGASTVTVTVEADALAVQADSNVVSTLISSEQITEIATENHNFAALAALGLGVSSGMPDNNTPTSVAASFDLSVNGLRWRHNIWLIDGGESDDRGGGGGMAIMPSQEAIAEFNMMTSNYPPDYGISSGATMSLSLKSGTQKYHGELWEFNRNTDYDANQYFNKLSTPITPRSATHYNIYGVGAGGPIFIPGAYNTNKQKSFFYWNEEWRKILNSAGVNEAATIDSNDLPKSGTDLNYVLPLFVNTATSSFNSVVVPSVSTTSAFYLNYLKPLGLTGGPSGPPGNSNGYPTTGTPGPGNCFNGTTTYVAIPNTTPQAYQTVCTGTQTISHTLFNSNAIAYLNAGILPPANVSGQDKNISNNSNPIDVRDDVVRIDHKFTDKWQILGHFMNDEVSQGYAAPELGWLWYSYNTLTSTLNNPANSAAIKLSGTISPNLLVEGSINYDGNVINIVPSANTNTTSGWQAVNIPGFAIARTIWPGVTGFGGPYYTAEDTGSEPWHNAARDYEPKVDVSYTVGKHAMKYGFSYNRYTKNQQLFGDAQGDYGQGSLSNDGLMDMLMGLSGSYSQMQSAPIRHYVNETPSVYVLDNWHVNSRLSLQLGLRYDALPHAWERGNYLGNFVAGSYLTSQAPIWDSNNAIDAASPTMYTFKGTTSYINGIGIAGQSGFPRGAVENDYRTLQPRVGFSQDIFGNGKTVLRGGFGTFFERMQGNDIYNTATSPPFSPSLSINNNTFGNPGTNWLTGSVVNPATLPVFPANVTDMAQDYRAPAVAQFSLGVQHELRPSVIWVIQYVGNLEWHQSIERDLNNFDPANPAITPLIKCQAGDSGNKYTGDSCSGGFTNNGGENAYRAFPGYGTINQYEDTTNGSYSGFQTGVRVQNRWGLSGELDYTWSHEIDLTGDDLAQIDNPWNLKYDKGSGLLDRRQMINANYVYKLPIFAKGNSLAHSVIGGWEVAGTVIGESGVIPSNSGITTSLSYDPIGLSSQNYTNRPNITGSVTYPKTRLNYFSGTFTAPKPSWVGGANLGFGNIGKDLVVGPPRVNFTTSLYKSFAMTERAHFELRFESFNTFNHTEFQNIGNSWGSSNFGQVTSTWDPRVLELGGKFVF